MQLDGIRAPAVAGKFYPADAGSLASAVDACLARDENEEAPPRVIGCVAPHAGYMYSGTVAGAVYSRLPARPVILVLGPNHFARGREPLALSPHAQWRTPLGEVPVNADFTAALEREWDALAPDAEAHASEHSIEVQLPFLQRRMGEFSFVPVAIGAVDFGALAALGSAIARAVKDFPDPVLIVASSDMNHYEPDALTRIKDGKAIERILALDPEGLWETKNRISMCGIGPAAAMLCAAKLMGAASARLVKYATSADAGGDRRAVVGYAGIIIQ